MESDLEPNIVSFRFNPAGGNAVFAGTDVQVEKLFRYLIKDRLLAEFLNDFPGVSREQAIKVLKEADAHIDDVVVLAECKRRSAEMDEHPESSISMEEFERSIRDRFPAIAEQSENE